jgi:tRNA-Thr(GGU) m(6)t(6)A37 methyltransferase TsaA
VVTICYTPIGLIRTPFVEEAGMPIQAVAARDVCGSVELDPAYLPGLRDLTGFSHLILLYHLHRVRGSALEVTPFLDEQPHGVFATRSPKRPNPIGLSTVRLLGIDGAVLQIADIDVVDGTPLLDIKPYVPQFDDRAEATIGWFASQIARLPTVRADGRFVDPAASEQ